MEAANRAMWAASDAWEAEDTDAAELWEAAGDAAARLRNAAQSAFMLAERSRHASWKARRYFSNLGD
jgi:hypothetical protein